MAEVKSAHGGRRLNSGRKQSLSFWERMEIGGLCEAKWSSMAKAAALEAYERQPHIIDVSEEQRRLIAIPVKFRGHPEWIVSKDGLTVAETIAEVSQEIDASLSSAGVSRYSRISIRRPQRAKDSILEEVLGSIADIPGKKPITKRMVKKCWDEFRSLQTWIKSELT